MVRVVPMHVGQTALGTAVTTDAVIGGADFNVPVWAKSILAMTVGAVTDLPTATESLLTATNLQSQNLPIQPFQAFGAPIGSILGGSGGAQSAAKPEKYDINLPCNGGELITCNMRDLVASTSANYGSIILVCSDARPQQAQQHIQRGTLTAGLTINSELAGTQYQVSKARNILELLGVYGGTTQATSEGVIGRVRFTSTEFDGLNQADLMLPPIPSGLATLQVSHIDGVGRQKCVIPMQPVTQCNIQDTFRFISSANIGANLSFCSAVAYEV